MKNVVIVPILFLVFIAISCKKEASLQSYLVESQNKKEFINLDVPVSIIQLNMNKASQDDKEAFESVRKINITGLPHENTDEKTYEAEKEKLKQILGKSDYKKLINFNKDGIHATIYYLGKTDAINEIIAFGYGDKMGIGIARLLGNNMNPTKIMTMMKNSDFNINGLDLNQFKSFFK